MQRLFEDLQRRYEGTHPWLTFKLDLTALTHEDWLLLGEAGSKCAHISGVPLKPDIAEALHRIYLTKGIHGTTAIEGNTLSEEQVAEILSGNLDLPPSQEYLEQEVLNIVDACNRIIDYVRQSGPRSLTRQLLCEYNGEVLRDLELQPGVIPGSVRSDSVGVRSYLGAPAEDCEYLLDSLCDWLNGPDFQTTDSDPMGFVKVFAKAIVAHLYLAWIHPFGDGNGRTARLVEIQIMVESGVPLPAAHLLSDHYNRTRTKYYQVLDRTSREPFSPTELLKYAIRGFVDELKGQLAAIRDQQLDVTWQNYVHDVLPDSTVTARRQKHLVLDLPHDWTPRSEVRRISPRIAEEYGGKQQKTVNRDINALESLDLIERSSKGVRPRREIVTAFLPFRVKGPVGI